MWLLHSLKLFTKTFISFSLELLLRIVVFRFKRVAGQLCLKEFPICQARWRIQNMHRQFPNALLICLISREVYRKWKYNCCLSIYPLAKVKDENNVFFFFTTEKKTIISLYCARFYLPIYTEDGILLKTDCIRLKDSKTLTVPHTPLSI